MPSGGPAARRRPWPPRSWSWSCSAAASPSGSPSSDRSWRRGSPRCWPRPRPSATRALARSDDPAPWQALVEAVKRADDLVGDGGGGPEARERLLALEVGGRGGPSDGQPGPGAPPEARRDPRQPAGRGRRRDPRGLRRRVPRGRVRLQHADPRRGGPSPRTEAGRRSAPRSPRTSTIGTAATSCPTGCTRTRSSSARHRINDSHRRAERGGETPRARPPHRPGRVPRSAPVAARPGAAQGFLGKLRELAADPRAESLPAPTAVLLASFFEAAGDIDAAAAILRQGRREASRGPLGELPTGREPPVLDPSPAGGGGPLLHRRPRHPPDDGRTCSPTS